MESYVTKIRAALTSVESPDDTFLPQTVPQGRTGTSCGIIPVYIQHLYALLWRLENEIESAEVKAGTVRGLALATTHNLLNISLREHAGLMNDGGELCLVRGWNMIKLDPIPKATARAKQPARGPHLH